MRGYPDVLFRLIQGMVCCVCILGSPQIAQCDDISLLGRWERGPCFDVKVAGNLAYYGAASSLQIVDISKPGEPIHVGDILLPSVIQGIDIVGSLAYIADSAFGLQIVDITQPSAPTIIGSAPAGTQAKAVTVSGGLAFVVESLVDLRIFDVSDPTDPHEIGHFDQNAFAQDVAIRDHYAFVSTWDGVFILDIADPTSPTLVALIPEGPYYGFEGVTLRGRYAYLAAEGTGMEIYDISDPTSPQWVSLYNAYGQPLEVDLIDNIAIVACRGSGLRAVDISDPSHPIEVSRFDAPYGTYGIECVNDLIYVAAFTRGMRIVDGSNPMKLKEISFCFSGSYGTDLVVQNDLAYIAESYSGLRVMDVSDPTDPTPIGLYRTDDDYVQNIAIQDHFVYLGSSQGMRIIDISNPALPEEVALYGIPGSGDLAIAGDYAFLTVYDKGFLTLDISTPESPTIHNLLPENDPYAVAVAGPYAYYAGNGGFQVVDYTIEGIPEILGSYPMYKATDIGVAGGIVFLTGVVAEYGYVLMSFDVSDPYNPQPIDLLELDGGPVTTFGLTDEYVYTGDYYGDLRAYDISDPAQLKFAAIYTRPGYHTRCIAAQDDMIYTGGIWIFRNEMISSSTSGPAVTSLMALRSSPNPFARSTAISYRLGSPAFVRLGIYDASGRLVRLLKNGAWEGAESHTVTWNGCNAQGSDAGAGVYFYQLETGSQKETRRMILLK
ncbi:MAG: T9SS type A sorting domain-containing protein [Candidatus Eisenbacteria bacterium]|nr:T9SS type A sorting domain-containing protein [Candidatus Eisenbacteria bacterium]